MPAGGDGAAASAAGADADVRAADADAVAEVVVAGSEADQWFADPVAVGDGHR